VGGAVVSYSRGFCIMTYVLSLRTFVSNKLSKFVHPTIVFGVILIAISWLAATAKVRSEAENYRSETVADVSNSSLLFEQDVLRTATELDRVIKFLRRSYELSAYAAEWPSLISEDFVVNARTVQIAIIDKKGVMISSTAKLRPQTPVDLSDREHFRVHAYSRTDHLFISEPILGRASGKWTVQFTRPFFDAGGSFNGVIVVSLDPHMLVSTYGKIQSQQSWGFALLGADDVIRSGAGYFAKMLGRDYWPGTQQTSIKTRTNEVAITRELVDGRWRIVGNRKVDGMPLTVVVTVDEVNRIGSAPLGFEADFAAAAIFTVLVIVVVLTSTIRDRRHVRRITGLAHKDSLTGLNNRLSFRKKLDGACVGQPETRSFAVHLIDLDRFKPVNDIHGHPVGDQVLVAVAERLRAAVREKDVVYRLGGDEFALIQMDCSTLEQAGSIGARVCRILAEPFEIAGRQISIGASVGVALGKTDGLDATALLQAADMALYLAKSEGRGTHRYFNVDLSVAYMRRRQMEADLSVAVDRGELVLHYQPKITIKPEREVCGYEALIRWQHPKQGMMPPVEFISLAEETGLIVQIGEWVLLQACMDLALQPEHLTIAVNCSPVQFSRGDVIGAVKAALSASGLKPNRLEIEITETVLMHNDGKILSQLLELRALGVRISLDDFGTGYSSLSYLQTYPVDCIKIDRSFVKTLGNELSAGPIIRAIVALAGELNMSTVAEGVETQQQLDELTRSGCTAVQGYLFSRPLAAADILPVNPDGKPLQHAA
jgi:diguanylate cyclase (GGDEF)-like protein